MPEEIGVAYHALRLRVREVVEGAGPDAGERHAPATPDWTVHDVLAHMVGVADDVVNGRMDGVASDAWTGNQVDLRRDKSTAELFDEWDETGPIFEELLAAAPAEIGGQALFDAATHEQDIRHALSAPGARDSEAVNLGFDWLVDARTRGSGPTLHLVTERDDVVTGAGDAVATVKTTRFELVRACTGRRTRDEIAAYGWDPSPQPDLLLAAAFFTFRTEPLHE